MVTLTFRMQLVRIIAPSYYQFQKSDRSFNQLLYCYVLVLGAALAENRESGEIPELSSQL